MFNNDTGNGIYIYGIKGNSRVDAAYTACNKAHASTYTANNNNCVVATCEAGYEVEGSGASNSCKAKTYTVTFNANGGSGLTYSTKTVTFGEAYGDLPTINSSSSCDNYSFSGWYTARTGGSRVTNTTTVSQTTDHTLWARRSYNGDCCTWNCPGGGVLKRVSGTWMCTGKTDDFNGEIYRVCQSDGTWKHDGATNQTCAQGLGMSDDTGYTKTYTCGSEPSPPCDSYGVGHVYVIECTATCTWRGDYAATCD